MRITESQLRRIIRQEVRALHEGPGKKGSKFAWDAVAAGSLLGTQTEVNIDGALSQWRRLVAVTNAEEDLKRARAAAKGLTHAKVEAALADAVGSMLGSGMGMTGEDIVNYIENRAYEMDFREEDARDIARAARSRLQAANIP